jgi:CheY-like chemotaxis protein
MSSESLIGKRILIVEDEMMLMLLLDEMLASFGVIPVAAPSVAAALQLVNGGEFDAATLDINLGTETSYRIADELQRRQIPFLFISGYGMHLSAGYNDVPILRKPFTITQLADALAALLPDLRPDARANESAPRP